MNESMSIDWSQIFNAVFGHILNLQVRWCSYHDAEDLAAIAVAKALEKHRPDFLSGLAPQESAQCLAFGIAKNRVRKWEAQKSRRHQLLSEMGADEVAARTMGTSPPWANAGVEAAEEGSAMEEALSMLDAADREVLDLWVQGNSMKAIADAVGVKPNTAKQRVHRARRQAQANLTQIKLAPLKRSG